MIRIGPYTIRKDGCRWAIVDEHGVYNTFTKKWTAVRAARAMDCKKRAAGRRNQRLEIMSVSKKEH